MKKREQGNIIKAIIKIQTEEVVELRKLIIANAILDHPQGIIREGL